jgi:hypothetical protein
MWFCPPVDSSVKTFMEKKKWGRYRCAIFISICVACSFYKLIHGVKYLQCNEMFVIGKSIVHLVQWEFVFFLNKVFGGKYQVAKRKGFGASHDNI